jgi:hypothetical protein
LITNPEIRPSPETQKFHKDSAHQNKKNISANETRPIKTLRNYFLRYPNSKPSSACEALNLTKKYWPTARVVKHRIKKTWSGVNVMGDLQKSQTHRQLWYLMGGVPDGAVLDALIRAARAGCNRPNQWFNSGNRNGQLNFRSDKLALRILPSTRRLEVLSRIHMTGIEIQEAFREILFSSLAGQLTEGYNVEHIAKELASKLVPKEKHHRFKFPSGGYWKVRYYEDSLGLIIQRDSSEGLNEIEILENTPPWIQQLIDCIRKLAEDQRATKEMMLKHLCK